MDDDCYGHSSHEASGSLWAMIIIIIIFFGWRFDRWKKLPLRSAPVKHLPTRVTSFALKPFSQKSSQAEKQERI